MVAMVWATLPLSLKTTTTTTTTTTKSTHTHTNPKQITEGFCELDFSKEALNDKKLEQEDSKISKHD